MKVADAVGDAIVVGIDGTSPGIDVTTFVAALWCDVVWWASGKRSRGINS